MKNYTSQKEHFFPASTSCNNPMLHVLTFLFPIQEVSIWVQYCQEKIQLGRSERIWEINIPIYDGNETICLFTVVSYCNHSLVCVKMLVATEG
jgi:hypothetical protein